MAEPVRMVLIGCGRIAQVAHLPALEKAEGVRLLGISDPSAEVVQAVTRRYDLEKAYADPEAVWADESVEAVIVSAPDRFHSSLATDALNAGKHILIEKPLTSTVQEAEALVQLVGDSGLKLQVGAMKRHDQGLRFAREFVADSMGQARTFNAWYRIGDLRPGIEATLFPRVFADAAAHEGEVGFKADRQRYLLATHGAHIFDTVRFLLGDVAAVVVRHREDGRNQAWQMLVSTKSGAVGTVSITADVPGLPAEGIEVFGARGSLRVDTHFPFYRRASSVSAYSGGKVITPVLTDGDAYERQAENFARVIRQGGKPDPDVHDGLAALRLIEATASAVESGSEARL